MSKDIDHLFIGLFATHISSLMTGSIRCGGERGSSASFSLTFTEVFSLGGGVFYSKASIKESYKNSFTKPAGGFTLGVRRQENKKLIRANVGSIPGDNSCKAFSKVLSTQSCIQ